MSFARAHLLVEGGSHISFWFNPTTLQRERRASYNSRQAVGQAAPTLEYLGTAAESLSLDLLLHAQDGTTGEDVSDALAALDGLIKPKVSVTDTKQQRPRTVQLVWGEYTSRVSVCESVSTTIELFDYDGTPLRALVALRLVQAKPEPGDGGQNPTTRATHLRRSHLVHAGDTLAGISFAHYGDPTRWRAIADANDIDDPLRLYPGEHLTVPLEAT